MWLMRLYVWTACATLVLSRCRAGVRLTVVPFCSGAAVAEEQQQPEHTGDICRQVTVRAVFSQLLDGVALAQMFSDKQVRCMPSRSCLKEPVQSPTCYEIENWGCNGFSHKLGSSCSNILLRCWTLRLRLLLGLLCLLSGAACAGFTLLQEQQQKFIAHACYT